MVEELGWEKVMRLGSVPNGHHFIVSNISPHIFVITSNHQHPLYDSFPSDPLMSDIYQNPSGDPKLNIEEYGNTASQNLPIAVIAGLVAAVVSAAIWAAITISTGYQIGWMAVGIGILVGLAVRLGKGVDPIYRKIGAVLALLGCILGNFFTLVGFIASEEKMRVSDVMFQLDYPLVPGMMIDMSSPIDLLFYAIAIYEGFKFAVKEAIPLAPQA
jgi:hypothetical protein